MWLVGPQTRFEIADRSRRARARGIGRVGAGPGLRRLPALLVSALLTGCLSPATLPDIRPQQSLAERLVDVGVRESDLVDPAAVSEEMAEWVRQQVDRTASEEEQVRQLFAAITEADGLALEYESSFTGTAREVFASRKANCLAFTHLVVGLGRELSLPVYYLGFRQRPRYERQGDLVVAWEHVTAGFGPEGRRLVLQLAAGSDIEYDDPRQLSDRTAVAMYYSNRGAELLGRGEVDQATDLLRIATAVDPEWSHGWVNLGVALRRSGDLDAAESAYRRALVADPDSDQAYHNLAALLWIKNERDTAGQILRLLARGDNRNPFLYLSLGDMGRRSGRLGEARRFYQRAARLQPGNPEPSAALGQLALLEGKLKLAVRYLRKAENRDASNERSRALRRAIERQSGS